MRSTLRLVNASDPSRACDLCGSTSSEFVLSKNGADYRSCTSCGFIFADCSESEWDEWNEAAFEEMLPGYIERSFAPKKQERYRRRLQRLERYFGQGKLLEIGSNVGGFLHAARESGWSAVGLEPVDVCARYARQEKQLDVRTETAEEANFEPGSFDVLYSSAVFEHLWSPTRTLQRAVEWLRPGGIVFLDTVNWDSYTRERIGASWKLVDPRVHACLYTPRTLSRLCELAGLEVVRLESHRVRLRPNGSPAPRGLARYSEELRKLPLSVASRFNHKGESIAVVAQRPVSKK